MEIQSTLLSKDLKRNLFQLFATWSGSLAKPLGVMYNASNSSANNDEEKLQFSALQVRNTNESFFLNFFPLFHFHLYTRNVGRKYT